MGNNHKIKHGIRQRDWAAFRTLVGGMLGMVVAMGIGRFAFTPILPLMKRDLGMSNTVAGWLAGLNYLGYLFGAVACTIAPQIIRSQIVGGGALLLSLVCTACMGMTLSVFWWGGMRLAGGLASAILFIVISAEVGETLTRRGYGHWFGALYGGVGLGIALSGLIIPQLDKVGGWNAAWTGIGVIAAIFAITGTFLGRTCDYTTSISGETLDQTSELSIIWLLAIAYFFEGLGYIVTATFIVAIVAMTPGLEAFAPYCWVVVGLSAIPSTIFWPRLARRVGNKRALLAAYAIQAAGIVVSRYATSIAEVIFVAVSFGGTFLGIVALTLGEGNQRMGLHGRRAAAFLTASFSVGQILGPVIAGILADRQDRFAIPLLFAAVSVGLGGVFIMVDQRYQPQNQ